jgi:hypothetical protein
VYSVGQVWGASDVNNWALPVAAYRTSTQSVTSSTTPVNDNQLSVSVAANAVYRVELCLTYTADTAGDLKIGWAVPASATFAEAFFAGITSAGAASTDDVTAGTPSANPVFGGIGGGAAGLHYIVMLTTAGTAGTLQFQFAQGTSSATATILLAGSNLIAQRVG